MSNKLGRPRKILDENKIAQLVGKGFTVEWVADFMGVHVDTLYANYSDALRKGKVFRNGCLQAKQYKVAMATGDKTMLVWLGKQWLEQADKNETTVKGHIEHEFFDTSRLSDADLAEVERLVQSAGAASNQG